jgi:hypothetical protein
MEETRQLYFNTDTRPQRLSRSDKYLNILPLFYNGVLISNQWLNSHSMEQGVSTKGHMKWYKELSLGLKVSQANKKKKSNIMLQKLHLVISRAHFLLLK